jgi:Tfp pilus assembly protein PilO
MQEKLRLQQEEISQISNLKNEIAVLDVRITKADIKLKEAQKNYDSRTKLFHSNKEKEELYSHISMLALQHRLSVSKINPMEREPIFAVQKKSTSKKEKDEPRKVAYYVFKVEFEISGNYANYTSFRKSMAELKKIINIEDEKIIVLKSKERAGEVKVSAILATYSVPNKDEVIINTGGSM